MVTPVTIRYDVEKISRLELNKRVDLFLQDLCARTPLKQLAAVEVNPGLILPAMASDDLLATLAHYRSVCRLFAHIRTDTSVDRLQGLRVLEATVKAKTML
uniref:Uncharacterized protein n=1 Tax=Hyaloperonospora arabidopsidis (strain Emoy2) TaxID=559515 RepID=M4BRH9_HYAAE